MGYNDFGDYYYAHGYLADAFKSYARTRDYCTTSKHVIHTCMSAILVSIEMGQFTHVTSYVSKAEQTAEALEPPTVSKLRCAAGLAHLEAKKYKLAARKVCLLVYLQCIQFSMNIVIIFFFLLTRVAS
jgi:COP9 signalosome complex subunit 1